jgi:5'-deoxy-5'-methylthioadenosine phosphorylase
VSEGAKEKAITVAVIGGSGLYGLEQRAAIEYFPVHTPYSAAPVQLALERTSAGAVWFIPRHGAQHTLAPHEINYRANLWALHEAGVRTVIAINTVGGITEHMPPGTLVLPDQLIDYSWGREHTFNGGPDKLDRHVDFTWPYDAAIGTVLQQSAHMLDVPLRKGAVYACTQGPRLETAAEIRKLLRDGCDIVGMTGMPEAALARELGLRYACLALVVNKAAGMGEGEITAEQMREQLHAGIGNIRAVLLAALPQFA